MSARAAFCRRRLGRRKSGCQVDSLPGLSVPCFSALSSGRILSGVSETAGSPMEPSRALDRHGSVGSSVVLGVPNAVVITGVRIKRL